MDADGVSMNVRPFARAITFFPYRWRVEHAAEMIGTLMEIADVEGRSKPTAAEILNLAHRGLRMRLDDALPRNVRELTASVSFGFLAALALLFLGLHVVPFRALPLEESGLPFLIGSSSVCGLILVAALVVPLSRSASSATLVLALSAMLAVATCRSVMPSVLPGPSTAYLVLFCLFSACALLGRVNLRVFLLSSAASLAVLLGRHAFAGILDPRHGQAAFWYQVAGPNLPYLVPVAAGTALLLALARAFRSSGVLALLTLPWVAVSTLWTYRNDSAAGTLTAAIWMSVLGVTVAIIGAVRATRGAHADARSTAA